MTGIPETFASLLKVYYLVANNKLMIAIDKTLLTDPILSAFVSPQLEKYGLNLQQLVDLMIDLGGYYALPINYMVSGGNITFYISKDMITQVLNMLAPTITVIPTEYSPIIQLLPSAEKADIGLTFFKYR